MCLSQVESWELGRALGRVFLRVYNAIVITCAATLKTLAKGRSRLSHPHSEQEPGEVFSVAGS